MIFVPNKNKKYKVYNATLNLINNYDSEDLAFMYVTDFSQCFKRLEQLFCRLLYQRYVDI